jgi:hypothetical protein
VEEDKNEPAVEDYLFTDLNDTLISISSKEFRDFYLDFDHDNTIDVYIRLSNFFLTLNGGTSKIELSLMNGYEVIFPKISSINVNLAKQVKVIYSI